MTTLQNKLRDELAYENCKDQCYSTDTAMGFYKDGWDQCSTHWKLIVEPLVTNYERMLAWIEINHGVPGYSEMLLLARQALKQYEENKGE